MVVALRGDEVLGLPEQGVQVNHLVHQPPNQLLVYASILKIVYREVELEYFPLQLEKDLTLLLFRFFPYLNCYFLRRVPEKTCLIE